MPLQPVHVFVKDRASNRAQLTHINPTRIFGLQSGSGTTWYQWQNGAWYGQGGNVIDESDVPAEFRESVATVPFIDTELANGPSVTRVCKFCKEQMNASAYDEHLSAHVEKALRGSAARGASRIPDSLKGIDT